MDRKYLYRFAKYPDKLELVENITITASNLETKLKMIDFYTLNISEYNTRYFGDYIKTEEKRTLNLQKYCYILSWVLAGLDKPKEEIVFLDHGGGHGMMSLLAKEYGVGRVIHNDIYPVSCEDAQEIAKSLNLEADIYIPGVIDDVIQYLNKNEVECDAVASYDVIEHIYDIDDFLKKLHLLSSDTMSIFMGSAANERNPFINHQLKSMHREFEYNDRAPKYGRKPTDATRAIIELRKEIIAQYSKKLSVDAIEKLAKLTRGLVVKDIHVVVDEYHKTSVYPQAPMHPTNTCDPYTGNWFEHLLNPDELVKTLDSTGFNAKVVCGYYNSPKKNTIRIIKYILNFSIRTLGKKGLFFAPYFALMAVK